MTASTPAPGPDIGAIELLRMAVPLRVPHRAAHGVETVRRVTLVRAVRRDGEEGWGECAALARPTYTHEYADGAFRMLRDVLAPAWLEGRTPRVVGHNMARAALSGAALDADLRARGTSLAAALGGVRGEVPCAAVVAAGTAEETVAQVGQLVAQGFGSVSVKIAPGADLEPLGAVRSAWPQLELAADANGSYESVDLVPLELDRLELRHLEQPLPADDLVGLGELGRRLDTSIALDESVDTRHDLEAAVVLGAGSVLNVKPARVGGGEAACDLATRARAAGWSVFCGGMLETGVGRAHALAVAALESCDLPTHLGPSGRYFVEDLTPPFELLQGGRLAVPAGPGIGVRPDPARLEAHLEERVRLEAPE